MKALGNVSVAMVSGGMQLPGGRRWFQCERGFVLSDHADWNGLLVAVQASGAGQVLVYPRTGRGVGTIPAGTGSGGGRDRNEV